MFGNLAAIINAMANEYTPPAGLRQFRDGKHSKGYRRKADPRRKKHLRKISTASRQKNWRK